MCSSKKSPYSSTVKELEISTEEGVSKTKTMKRKVRRLTEFCPWQEVWILWN